jgi:hypothetical protein
MNSATGVDTAINGFDDTHAFMTITVHDLERLSTRVANATFGRVTRVTTTADCAHYAIIMLIPKHTIEDERNKFSLRTEAIDITCNLVTPYKVSLYPVAHTEDVVKFDKCEKGTHTVTVKAVSNAAGVYDLGGAQFHITAEIGNSVIIRKIELIIPKDMGDLLCSSFLKYCRQRTIGY